MSLLLRKYSRSKWQDSIGKNLENHSSDAITGCTRTQQKTLSVWASNSSNFDSDENKLLITALATSMQNPDAIDIILLSKNKLLDQGIEIVESEGDSPFSKINQKHRDLALLDYGKLGIISQHIVERLADDQNSTRITKNKLIELVINGLTTGKSDGGYEISDLSEKWQTAIARKMGDHAVS